MLSGFETWHFFKEQQIKARSQFDSTHCDIAFDQYRNSQSLLI